MSQTTASNISGLPLPKDKATNAVLSRPLDFWLMGGASILLWIGFIIADAYRHDFQSIEQRFMQLSSAFAILSLVCNHPHFLVSYSFGYSRGFRFIFKNWLALLAVPLFLIFTYGYAFFHFNDPLPELRIFPFLNSVFEFLGMKFRVGELGGVGVELMSLSIWAMYITVGWHYSKQVFGCMMIYAKYDHYELSQLQRRIIKISLFSIAFFNFAYFASAAPEYQVKTYFFNIPMMAWGLPEIVFVIAKLALMSSAAAVLYFVIYRTYREKKRFPSANFIIPFISFFVWWAPLVRQMEFYIFVIPFFHSLQYLPFAFRLGANNTTQGNKLRVANFSVKIAALLVAGFLFFEFIPNILDEYFGTSANQITWFFTIAALVFINIHHFFIDSVVWKFRDKSIKNAFFSPTE